MQIHSEVCLIVQSLQGKSKKDIAEILAEVAVDCGVSSADLWQKMHFQPEKRAGKENKRKELPV